MLLRLQPGQPFLVSEAAAAGITRGALRSMTQSGALRRLLPGVYVDAQVPDTQLLRANALARVLPSDAVACRGTAAWLLGVPVERLRNAEHGGVRVEICRERSTTGVRREGVRGFVAPLPPHDVLLVHGVPCTSPVRTALDLARWCDRWDGLAYLDAMVRFGLVSQSELEGAVPSLEGLPWCEQGTRTRWLRRSRGWISHGVLHAPALLGRRLPAGRDAGTRCRRVGTGPVLPRLRTSGAEIRLRVRRRRVPRTRASHPRRNSPIVDHGARVASRGRPQAPFARQNARVRVPHRCRARHGSGHPGS
jgi:hypothetical protein